MASAEEWEGTSGVWSLGSRRSVILDFICQYGQDFMSGFMRLKWEWLTNVT